MNIFILKPEKMFLLTMINMAAATKLRGEEEIYT